MPNTPDSTLPHLSMPSGQPLTVAQLNHQVRFLLETNYGSVTVQGEISNLSRPASGHIYFTLKDANAQIRVAMFRSSLNASHAKLKNGDQVIVRGRISLYEARGDYQLIATSLKPAGEGALQLAFLQLKERLEKEGLFDPAYKQALPDSVNTIGVITSPTGAAVHDILTVLKRRFPAINVILYPVVVQGNEAPGQICRAIELANAQPLVDVLIVGRGGGSLEDLWSFNDEQVARAIFASRIPIVAAVGHEVDFTIADFVADHRAPTPSAAAELLSPDQQELIQGFDRLEMRLRQQWQAKMQTWLTQIQHLRQRLRHPGERLAEQQNRLDQLQHRLVQTQQHRLQQQQHRLSELALKLQARSPERQLALLKQKLATLQHGLRQGMQQSLKNSGQQLGLLSRQLNAVSPLAVLERGYSVTFNEQGEAVRDANVLKAGDQITTRLHQGSVQSQVIKTIPSKD